MMERDTIKQTGREYPRGKDFIRRYYVALRAEKTRTMRYVYILLRLINIEEKSMARSIRVVCVALGERRKGQE